MKGKEAIFPDLLPRIVLCINMAKKRKIVVDSSVIVKWLNSQDEKNLTKADRLLKDCEKGKVVLYAPELAKYEVGNAILYKGLDISLAKASLETLNLLPITFVPLSKDGVLDTFEITSENKITYYDATFIDLAEKIEGELVTDNPKHQKKVKGVKIIPLRNYR